jgi:hypothetical protein
VDIGSCWDVNNTLSLSRSSTPFTEPSGSLQYSREPSTGPNLVRTRWIQSAHSKPISSRSILIVSSHSPGYTPRSSEWSLPFIIFYQNFVRISFFLPLLRTSVFPSFFPSSSAHLFPCLFIYSLLYQERSVHVSCVSPVNTLKNEK